MITLELSVVSTLYSVFALWVLGMFAASMSRSRKQRRREKKSEELQPKMKEALVDYLAGNDDRTPFREFVEQNREGLEEAILSFQANVGGGARDRLCELTMEQSLLHDWCRQSQSRDLTRRRAAMEKLAFVTAYEPCRRVAGDLMKAALKDPDPEVRFSAAMGILQTGERRDVERVFQMALEYDLLTRILISEQLRRHAAVLCERVLPALLASENSDSIVAALDMLQAWQRALPLDLAGAMASRNREIRLRALRLAPIVGQTAPSQRAILDAFPDPDPEIALAAIQSAARLRIEAAVPLLANALRNSNRELARAAAQGLAEMPPRGWNTLEELSAGSDPVSAPLAAEVLERARGKAGL